MIEKRPGKTLLTVENLQVRLPTRRGYVRAVDGVSFELDQGESLGLVGESGCGKSMLARAIMGLLPRGAVISEDAKILFQGENILDLPAHRLRGMMGKDMTMIFQDPMTALNPVMRVGQQVAEVLTHHLNLDRKAARDHALELLKLVEIPLPERRLDQYPHQLSGGLCQRVAIAIALACEPQLLIADEPTTALDVTVQSGILDLLSTLAQEKDMGIILITHDLGVVAGRTDGVAVMYAGKIVEKAPTNDLFHHTAMPYTQALMDAVPRLANPPHTKLQTIEGQPPDLVDLPKGCRFALRCSRTEPRCREQEPGLTSVRGGDHLFACWHPLRYDER